MHRNTPTVLAAGGHVRSQLAADKRMLANAPTAPDARVHTSNGARTPPHHVLVTVHCVGPAAELVAQWAGGQAWTAAAAPGTVRACARKRITGEQVSLGSRPPHPQTSVPVSNTL